MDFVEFKNLLGKESKKLKINISDEVAEKIFSFMNLLIDWNKKINLTAIVEPKDIIVKHFIDSFTINAYIPKNANVIDIGTGAGFPRCSTCNFERRH